MTDELHPALDVDDLGRVSLGVAGDQLPIAGTSRAALVGASCGSPIAAVTDEIEEPIAGQLELREEVTMTNDQQLGPPTLGDHEDASRRAAALEFRYHVPRSQVWAGSRGGQSGNVHLELTEDFESGRLRRRRGQVLCSAKVPWYPRSLEPAELERLPAGACARCLEIAERHRLELPAELAGAPA